MASATTATTLAVSCAVARQYFGRSCPCRRASEARDEPRWQRLPNRCPPPAGNLSGGGLFRLRHRVSRRARSTCRGREGGQRTEGVRSHLGGEQVGLRDLAVDLLAVDGDLARGLEAEPDGAAPHLDDVDLDVVSDADRLADAAGECEHR